MFSGVGWYVDSNKPCHRTTSPSCLPPPDPAVTSMKMIVECTNPLDHCSSVPPRNSDYFDKISCVGWYVNANVPCHPNTSPSRLIPLIHQWHQCIWLLSLQTPSTTHTSLLSVDDVKHHTQCGREENKWMDPGRGAAAFASIGRRNQMPNLASWAFSGVIFGWVMPDGKPRGECHTVAGLAIFKVMRASLAKKFWWSSTSSPKHQNASVELKCVVLF